jgi:hypothetical protein
VNIRFADDREYLMKIDVLERVGQRIKRSRSDNDADKRAAQALQSANTANALLQ